MPTQHSDRARSAPTWTLAVPNAGHALRDADACQTSQPSGGPERASRRIFHASVLGIVLASVVATTVPITRTLQLDGQLVPERIITLRAAESGLLTDLHVAPGDRVMPRQLVARLHSPALDELARASSGHDPALLARRARLDVHAPPPAVRKPDGTADPATLWHGGIVLNEDLHALRGARFEAGDPIVELATIDPDGRIPYVVQAWAPERDALRTRPGMTACITFSAIPHHRPRQTIGTVRRVALAPDSLSARWRVELDIDPSALAPIAGADEVGALTELRAGVSVEVAVETRRETLARTATRWIRSTQRRPPTPRQRKPTSQAARTAEDPPE
ncbi:MAG: hypothetical protein SangKO_099080 [Sandaracinaceae bacterium]